MVPPSHRNHSACWVDPFINIARSDVRMENSITVAFCCAKKGCSGIAGERERVIFGYTKQEVTGCLTLREEVLCDMGPVRIQDFEQNTQTMTLETFLRRIRRARTGDEQIDR